MSFMSNSVKVAEATTQKKPKAMFLCRDWHNAIIKVCVVYNKADVKTVSALLEDIHNTFHYKFEGCSEEHAEFKRDLMLSDLFEELNNTDHEMLGGSYCDVWNPNGLKYHDCYWGF